MKTQVTVPFNNFKNQIDALAHADITIVEINHTNPNGIPELTLEGEKDVICKYLAELWGFDIDADEILELFEEVE